MNDHLRTSKNGLDFITKWEGCVLKPYKDIAGLRTIGVGHLIKPGENFPDGVEITMGKALEILTNDVILCENSIKSRIKVPLNQNQFDALVSFGFNCGTGVYLLSDACKTLNKGDYSLVPEKLLAWSKVKINGVMQVSKGLYSRRKSEGELFMKPVNDKDSQDGAIIWDKNTLKEAQTYLSKICLYDKSIDGLWGPGTSSGLTQFASQNCVSLGDDPKTKIPRAVFELLKQKSS